MRNAVGVVEWTSIALGIDATDAMVKAASVELLYSQPVCAGKYFAMIRGDVSAVNTAVTSGVERYPEAVVDHVVIPNPHPDLIPALAGAVEVPPSPSLGVVETFSVTATVRTADVVAKTGQVKLIEVRLACGLGGKAYLLMVGEVSAVEVAVQTARATAKEALVAAVVIPMLHRQLWAKVR